MNTLWGTSNIVASGHNYQVKEIVVSPGERTPMESHDFRNEVWHIVGGQGFAVVDDGAAEHRYHATYGKQFNVPVFAKHRLINTNGEDLVVIAIQFGSWLSEEDVTHYAEHEKPHHD
jgi:mannose-6-phosphate isomerase-like protein (cupin superfamily)